MITFLQLLEIYKPSEIGDFKKSISNFTRVDSRNTNWMMSLPQAMAKYGFQPVGSGKYGSVFSNPKYPYVIKVFMKDTAYLKWLSFCKDNQNNPLVPRIKGKVVRITPNFMAVRLEKLTPMTSDVQENLMYNQMDSTEWGNKVGHFIDENHKLIDLHPGNIMMRGKQPVIIDPFYNFYRDGLFSIDPDDLSGFKNLFVKI